MKFFRNIVEWIAQRYKATKDQKYGSLIVKTFPKKVESDTVYVVQEGSVPDTIIFECPCGCKDTVYLNLLRDTWPCWRFHLDKKGITVNPSVRRKIKCKSHFFVTNGKIEWCNDWDN